ncbi:MAG TPA: DNA-formamidopyrimidine glycosylase family protein [Candidatus Limnocylindrales bacterium]|nr:DNA-formamidopyrimidine glycosylase family protein [Candidatus Limnocylindrales bacterium]
MPELPDLAVLADALHAALAGRPMVGSAIKEPLVVRGLPAELEALLGQPLRRLTRRGKFLALDFERDAIVINPMLTGRLGLAPQGARPFPDTAAVLTLGPRAPGRLKPAPAPWTRRASWLPDPGRPVELRYRDATRMGKIYLLPAGVERPVPGWAEQGPDADDPTLDLAAWRERIRRHRGELKNLLREQTFVAGIGNGYSDEILWAAQLLPLRKRSTLAADEVDRLHAATREVLAWAVDELRRRVPPRFEVEVRDFLRVHRKGGQPCPRCGTTISQIAPHGFVTSFCRGCQR